MKCFQASGLLFNKDFTEVLLLPVGDTHVPISTAVAPNENCYAAMVRAADYFGKFFWKQLGCTTHTKRGVEIEDTWFYCNAAPDDEWEDLKQIEGTVFPVTHIPEDASPETVDAIFRIVVNHLNWQPL